MPAVRFKLGAEDNGSAFCPWLNDLKQVVLLLVRHQREQEFINDQQVSFLVRADHFQVSALSPRDSQPFQQVRDPDITDGKTVPARGNIQGIGKICFPVAGCPHNDDMAAVSDVAAAQRSLSIVDCTVMPGHLPSQCARLILLFALCIGFSTYCL